HRRAVDLGCAGDGVGAPRVDWTRRREACLGPPDARGLRCAHLDGPPRMGGAPRSPALDRRLHPRPVLVHIRQSLPLAVARVPMTEGNGEGLLVLGWNFRGASGDVRERVALTAEEVRDGLR